MTIVTWVCRSWMLGIVALVGGWAVAGGAAPLTVREQAGAGDFPLVAAGQAAPVWVDARDFTVVRLAADLLAGDVQRVSGVEPALLTNQPPRAGQAVLIGTLGHSALIDRLVAERKLDVSAIRGKWESHIIATVADPLPEVKSALVIAGSDRRGTAYGVFTLSEAMGVSPWYWWADVIPAHRSQVFVAAGTSVQGAPSVKYRGIFINDEVYGLVPWSAKTHEKDRKYMGPKTYARIFELLLRLKANYCWPGMYGQYFNLYPENKLVADDYGIVIGSSHCEPMLFNNHWGCEWDEKKDGPWNLLTNRDRLVGAWEKRVKENGRFENSYTIGLRGISDQPIQGGTTIPEKAVILQQAIDIQRRLLARYVSTNLASVCQTFCPYQEVLTLYRSGVQVPADVTLIWPDDNYGYIRQLSTPEEQKRSGRSGVYHHLAYWTWVWLCPISPMPVAYEMQKAYAYGADRIWVFNVGDIKPAEKELTFAMQMAWDIHRWTPENADRFLAEWAGETFGPEYAGTIAAVLLDYYRLTLRGFPEYLDSGFGCGYAPQEAAQRLADWRRISAQAEQLAQRIPARLQDAYYQLVLYPVKGARLVNEKVLLARRSLELAAQGDAQALALAKQAAQSMDQVAGMTRYYNEKMAGGKWNHMMGWYPRGKPEVATPALVAKGKAGQGVVPLAAWPDPLVTIPAKDFARKQERPDSAIHVLPAMGVADGVALMPFTAPSIPTNQLSGAAWVEYDLTLPDGPLRLQIRSLPTHRIHAGRGLRYAVSLNGGPATVCDLHAENETLEWWQNTARGLSLRAFDYAAGQPRKATLRLYLLDPGLVLQDIRVMPGGKSIPVGCVDQVNLDDDQSWAPAGERSSLCFSAMWKVNRVPGRGGWFSWKMNVLADHPNRLVCTYWGGETDRAFDILVDGVKVATQVLNGNKPSKFFEVTYPIPVELTRGKQNVTVKFQSQGNKPGGSVFGCRIVR